MNLIKTKSFELATYSKGDVKSDKFAIVLPGRLDTKDYPHMHSHVEYLASKGYFALSFDPPGTWESKGDISLYSMSNYLQAINELVAYFGNKPTLLVGHSRGGSMSMLAGTTNEKIIAFVAIMGSYSYKVGARSYPETEWKEKGYLLNKRDIPESDKFREYKLPYSFYEDQIQYDMSDGLKKCTKPKMFVYGNNDTTVEPEIVKKAYNISSSPKEIKEIDSDHDYRYKPEIINKVNILIGEFLDKYKL